LSKANWKVKAHQLSGENPEVLSRLSRQAGVRKISVRITQLQSVEWVKPVNVDYVRRAPKGKR
jgi:hypothetical protein